LRAKGFAEAGLLDPLLARSDEPAPTTFRVRLGCRRDWFDRNGLRLARNLPVPDTDKGARSDMEALGPLVEVGAELMVDLWRCAPRDHSFSFNVPLGLVYSVASLTGMPLTGISFTEISGVTVSPYLNDKIRQEDGEVLMRYRASIGLVFVSKFCQQTIP
jgi:hypothetical protein